MKLKKEDIAALQIADEIKADLIALFQDVETKQSEVDSLRAKMPTDSQKIVESVDYEKFVAATDELKRLKDELASKLDADGGEKGGVILEAFASFFS